MHTYYLLHTYYNLGRGTTFTFCHALRYTTYTIMYYGEKSFNLTWSDIFRQKKSFKTKKMSTKKFIHCSTLGSVTQGVKF